MLKISPAGNKEMNMQRRDFLKYSVRWGLPAHYRSGAVRFSRLTGLPYPSLIC
jgi:blue copper oxidase